MWMELLDTDAQPGSRAEVVSGTGLSCTRPRGWGRKSRLVLTNLDHELHPALSDVSKHRLQGPYLALLKLCGPASEKQQEQDPTLRPDTYINPGPACESTPYPAVTRLIHTLASGFQNLHPAPAHFHLESEHCQFCDAFGPVCLLADPGQCHPLFWGNPSLHTLFYSRGQCNE